MCENCTRREFLGTSAMGSVMLVASQTRGEAHSSEAPPHQLPSKVPICVMFAGKPNPSDRGWGVCEEEIAAMRQRLVDVERKLGNVEFVIGKAATAEQAVKLMKQAGDQAPVVASRKSTIRRPCRSVQAWIQPCGL